MRLIGRDAEQALLGEVLDGVRDGMSRTLVVCGAAGMGKTTLLDLAASSARDLQILRTFGIEPVDPAYRGEVAARWRYRDGRGEVGVITSVSQPFCGDCTRARLSAEGRLYTCLFAARGHDLRAPLRLAASDEELVEQLRAIWTRRTDRYSELRTAETASLPKVEMSYIGG